MCRASVGLGLEVETGGEEKAKRARCFGVFQLTRPTKWGGQLSLETIISCRMSDAVVVEVRKDLDA